MAAAQQRNVSGSLATFAAVAATSAALAAACQRNIGGSFVAARWRRQRQWRQLDRQWQSGGATATQHKLCISSCASARAILYSNIVRRPTTTAMKTSNVDDKASCASARQFHIASCNSDNDKDYWRRRRMSARQRGTRPHAQEHHIFTKSHDGTTTIVTSSWKKSTNHYNETPGNKVNN